RLAMHRLVRFVFAAAVFCGFAGIAPVASAQSANAADCAQRTVDAAHLFGGNGNAVDAHAAQLESASPNHAAKVVVRTVSSLGSFPTLDAYKQNEVHRCPSWQAADGQMNNNLIVFMVAKVVTPKPYNAIVLDAGRSWTRLDSAERKRIQDVAIL